MRTPATLLLAITPVLVLLSPSDAGAIRDRLAGYRRCIEVRAVLFPKPFASRDERTTGAALDCIHHRGRTWETVTSSPTPVPRILRSKRAKAALSRILRAVTH